MVEDLRIPWEMRFLPDGRLLVTEREGRIVIADVGSGMVTEVGRIEVSARGEGGLMGLALDPAFEDNGAIYVSYTYSGDGRGNRVSRFTLSGLDTGTPQLGAETVLVDGIPAGTNHDGSRVAFGPDGYLWVTTGDAGDGDRAQRMDSLAGKVLRMTSEGQPAPGNPFADRPYPFSLIYTLGHRNPQGLGVPSGERRSLRDGARTFGQRRGQPADGRRATTAGPICAVSSRHRGSWTPSSPGAPPSLRRGPSSAQEARWATWVEPSSS